MFTKHRLLIAMLAMTLLSFLLQLFVYLPVLNLSDFINIYATEIINPIQQKKDWFLDHLYEYGLILVENITNDSSISHHQYGGYRLYKDTNNSESPISFKFVLCASEQLGLGNILSFYFGAFSMAFHLDYDFEWTLCTRYPKLTKYHSKTRYFSSFLPKYYHIDTDHNNKTMMIWAHRDPRGASFIHPSSLAFLYYNRYFVSISNNIYNEALMAYYKYNNKSEPYLSPSNIVIQYRCGNMINLGDKTGNPRYGLLTTNYIKYAVTNGTLFGSKITANTTIYIISQLSKKSLRRHEMGKAKDCTYLINYMVNESLSAFFAPAQIEIIYDNDINDDVYRMVNAQLLICSPSSFCLMGAIGNKNGNVIMPSWGPWIDLNDIMDYESKHLIAKTSKLLPGNHVVIETMRTGWHLNGWADYNDTAYNLINLSRYIANN